MKTLKKISLRKLCFIAGCGLIVLSLIIMIGYFASTAVYEKQCKEYVDILRSIISPTQNTFPEERLDNTMPLFHVNGADFVALLEIPAFNSTLPVCNELGNVNKYPKRFAGSVYNNSFVIHGTDHIGQIDFVKQISIGDVIFITDMTGNRYTYIVSNIEISSKASSESDTDTHLVIFVKNTLSFDYTVIHCKSKA